MNALSARFAQRRWRGCGFQLQQPRFLVVSLNDFAVELHWWCEMESSDQLLEKINSAAERLSPAKKMELLDYVEYLLFKELKGSHMLSDSPLHESASDPLLQYIGGVTLGTLASQIDEDLYGF